MKDIKKRLGKEILFFDGALGTQLQKLGLGAGECPENRNITTPELLYKIHREYAQAGADIILANTFGANRLKLNGQFGVEAVVTKGIEIAKEAIRDSGREAYVSLDIGPTGKLLKPFGELEFEEAYEAFAEMVRAGVKGGADMVSVETMTDIYEAKAAILAVKENCELPLTVTVSFDASGKLLTGADPLIAATVLESLGADAIGVNCGLGPIQSFELLREMSKYTSLPLILCPNAGLPEIVEGRTEYNVSADEFAEQMKLAAKWGVSLLGGCCGTSPEHIAKTVEACRGYKPRHTAREDELVSYVTSYSKAVSLGKKPIVIGERLNPTGKPKLKEALRRGDMSHVICEATAEEDNGADVLDINAGLPEIDEAATMCDMIEAIQGVCTLPLQIDTASVKVLERALRIYNGRPLINSVNGKDESLETILPLAKKYGACLVALTLDENGIPETAEERIAIAEKIVKRCDEYGIPRRDIIVDTLTMTVGTGDLNARITLDALEYVTNKMKLKTVLGVSNVSFGLPVRESVTAAFLTMALQSGLKAAIINPSSAIIMNAFNAYLALSGQDHSCLGYISSARAVGETKSGGASEKLNSDAVTVRTAIVRGLKERSATLVAEELKSARDAMEIINGEIIPALDEVGDGFAKKTLFLPQLLMSADAAKSAFAVIKENMDKHGGKREKKGGVILATVKGDVHDIGKNIVKVLLENYGFEVIDLGKDVEPSAVLECAKESGIRLIGLSALMTTTVPAMEQTVKLLKSELPDCKVIVGGAVLNAEYAAAIGADHYSADATDSARYAEEFYSQAR